MSKVKSKENLEETIQLAPDQIAKAVAEAKKISESETVGKAQQLINWDKQILELKNNSPKSMEEAVTRVISSAVQVDTTEEHRQMLFQLMISNPHVTDVLKKFIK